jgi:3-methyladenine DNA glycosylase AlkD
VKEKPKSGAKNTQAIDGVADLVDFVQRSLRSRADQRKATEMAAYMKTTMPFYGVPQPEREAIRRELKCLFAIESQRDYERAVRALWKGKHREEKYLAVSLAQDHSKFIVPESLKLYERLIREGGWWDFVDDVAIRLVGHVLLEHRPKMATLMDRWINDDDMWIRRAALISQNKHDDHTDHARLFRYCLARAGEREFFIRKAIGWALRQYSYTAPDRVAGFLNRHREKLSPLSYREGSRVIIKRGLM